MRAELGEWEQALEDLNQAIDLARQEGQSLVLAYALSGRSLVWSGLEREQEAETDYQESISLCSTNPGHTITEVCDYCKLSAGGTKPKSCSS